MEATLALLKTVPVHKAPEEHQKQYIDTLIKKISEGQHALNSLEFIEAYYD